MALLPYTDARPPVGYLGKLEPFTFTNGNIMYYNGDFKCNRTYNAVLNDYAEFFKTEEDYNVGELVFSENELVGVLTDSYGRITGQGNSAVCLTGRVILNTNIECSPGDFLYYNNINDKIDTVTQWTQETISNKIGKVLYKISPNQVYILV